MNTQEQVNARCAAERATVSKLCQIAIAKGFTPFKVYDGGDIIRVNSEAEILDAVFAVDEATVWFRSPTNQKKAYCAVIVLGNDGYDAVADTSVGDDWDEVIAEHDTWVDAQEVTW